jgi:hypothetical protein
VPLRKFDAEDDDAAVPPPRQQQQQPASSSSNPRHPGDADTDHLYKYPGRWMQDLV